MPHCGSCEVRFFDGRPSQYFIGYEVSRRLRPELLPREEALEQARAVAPAEQDALDS